MRRLLAGLLLILIALQPTASLAGEDVDLALVIAVDVSNSMDLDEQALQREGFVQAFRAPQVHDAISKGMLGKIAVIYMDWAGVLNQRIVIPWTVIDSAEAASSFAARLEKAPNRRGPRTSISSAIDYAVQLLGEASVNPTRRVIDVSGDGPNNQGRSVTFARDEAVEKGITINGLPLMLKRPSGPWDIENLDHYYRDCVIGGLGAFMVPVRDKNQFAELIRTKIVREIAGIVEPAPRVILTQSGGRTNCLISERWQPPYN
jgi:hypothetical protein